jgi:recombinational DNA repair protein RecT
MVYFDEMTVDEVDQHQQRFCKGLKHANSLWYGGRKNPNFDAYGLKTILRRMINRYMPMNAKLARAIQNDPDSETAIDVTPEEVLPELLKGGEGDDGNQEERTKEGGQEKLL